MSEQQVTVKIWQKTRQKMRMAHVLSGESMCAILDRLMDAELLTLHAQGESNERGAFRFSERRVDPATANG